MVTREYSKSYVWSSYRSPAFVLSVHVKCLNNFAVNSSPKDVSNRIRHRNSFADGKTSLVSSRRCSRKVIAGHYS